MKLDFLSGTHRDGPVVRLYDAQSPHLQALAQAVAHLADHPGEAQEVHRLPGVFAIAGCELTLRSVSRRPRSIISRLDGERPLFVAQTTCDDWLTVRELLDPFLSPSQGSMSAFQWLLGGDARGMISASDIALLLTWDKDGSW